MKKTEQKHRVLVIEDQDEVRENIQELLELSNYDVATSPNGKDGVKQALDSPPDLILCDIMMPVMDGYEVLYLISKNPKTSKIPFIFLTARAERDDLRKGMNLGADDYITKPFEEMDLLEAIERRINRYESLIETSELRPLYDVLNARDLSSKLEDPNKVRVFETGDIIYREGDFGTYVYRINEGVVKTYKANYEGKELVHSLLKAGDFLGEQAVIQDSPRTEHAEALQETELLLIPRAEFQELIFSDREISAQFIRILSKKFD